MLRTSSLALVLSLVIAAPAAPAPSAAARPAAPALAKDGWPASELGALARRWTQAFSTGEKAMRETLPRILTPASLARRSLDARMETYRTLHERFGSLMLVSVDSVGVDELKVTLVTSDMSRFRFTFTTEPGPPRRLTNVSLMDRRPGGHGSRFGH